MSDRRSQDMVRCRVKGCPHVGAWTVPYCPGHIDDARANWKAALERATTWPEPRDPVTEASDRLGGQP